MITKFEIYEQSSYSNKIYESLNEGKPEIGDYVICDEDSPKNDVGLFIDNNIGRIVAVNKVWKVNKTHYPYIIEYYDVPIELKENNPSFDVNNCRGMYKSEIKYWSKNEIELEAILAGKKFNV